MKKLVILWHLLICLNSCAVSYSLPQKTTANADWVVVTVDSLALRVPSSMNTLDQSPHFLYLYCPKYNLYYNIINYTQIDAEYKEKTESIVAQFWNDNSQKTTVDNGKLKGAFCKPHSMGGRGLVVIGMYTLGDHQYRITIISPTTTPQAIKHVDRLCRNVFSINEVDTTSYRAVN